MWGICWNYESQRTNYLFSWWQLQRIARRDKKWSKFGQLQTLCCQKVYYDSGLQASKPLLGPAAPLLAESTLTDLCKWLDQVCPWSHRTIKGIFVPFEMYWFLSVFHRLFLLVSCMKPYVQFIQLYWLCRCFGSNKTGKYWASNDLLYFPFPVLIDICLWTEFVKYKTDTPCPTS